MGDRSWRYRQEFEKRPFFFTAEQASFESVYMAITSDPLKDAGERIREGKLALQWLLKGQAVLEVVKVMGDASPQTYDNGPLLALERKVFADYYAVRLMLIAYAVEILLKSCHLASFPDTEIPKEHRLDKLARTLVNFLLTDSELVHLELLSQYSIWAGRYPSSLAKSVSFRDKLVNSDVTLLDIQTTVQKVRGLVGERVVSAHATGP